MKKIAFIISVIALVCVFAKPVKSVVGASATSYIIESEAIENPYITDGLIAMWDGEWNAGLGIHDSNASVWKDLVGDRDAVLSGTYGWGDNIWYVESVSGQGIATWNGKNLPINQTIEIVVHPLITTAYGRLMAEGQWVASPVIERRTRRLYMYGYGVDIASEEIGGYSNLDSHCHTIVHPSGGPLYYYIDGSLKWERTTTLDSTGSTLAYFANRGNLQRGIDAYYYCVRIYNRTLSEEEIQHNYSIDKERFGLQ